MNTPLEGVDKPLYVYYDNDWVVRDKPAVFSLVVALGLGDVLVGALIYPELNWVVGEVYAFLSPLPPGVEA